LVVVGLGLIGGSVARGARRRSLAARITGVDRDASALGYARREGFIDADATLAAAVADADLVVLATPVGGLTTLAAELAPALSPRAVVTDVGSVKLAVVDRISAAIPRFVGGHPMAGGERSGAQASSPDLFEGATCFVTPTGETDPAALETVERLWKELGATVVRMDAKTHDEVVAAVSHLPHMAAYALVNTVASAVAGHGNALAYAAGGFRDMTRIAASSPEMWRDICLMNRGPLVDMLGRYVDAAARLRDLIGRGDGPALLDEFARAQAVRERLA
jgi:prephenate dehydrogenase